MNKPDFGIEAISPDTVFISGQAITEQDALNAIDVAIKALRDSNDISTIDLAERTLFGLQRISGKALAKLLYEKKSWWNETNQTSIRQCTFEDYEKSQHGLSSVLIDRYTVVWEKMQEFPIQLQERPIRDLIPIAKAVEQGYEISESQWNKLIKAASNSEVLHILREEVKGKTPRKSSMRILMERDGTLNVWKGSKKSFVGYVDVNSKDDLVQKAISRLLSGAGVLKK